MENEDDFQPGFKRVKTSEETDKESHHSSEESNDEENGGNTDTCIFCFEAFTTSGSHRLVSLKCGHLFGKSCLEKWLKSNQKCPQCNARAKKSEMHFIFTKNLTVTDNSEVERLKIEMLEVKRENNRLIEREYRTSMLLKASNLEIAQLRKEILDLRSSLNDNDKIDDENIENKIREKLSFQFLKSYSPFKGVEKNSLRCIAFEPSIDAILCSRSSFKGDIGILKIPAETLCNFDFYPCHEKQIRCLKSSNFDYGQVLTGSLDKSLCLSSITQKSLVTRFQLPTPVWSCSFDLSDRNYVYAGTLNNTIYIFDIRNPSKPACDPIKLQGLSGHAPVSDLEYLERGLVGRTQEGIFFVKNDYVKNNTLADVKNNTLDENFCYPASNVAPGCGCTSISGFGDSVCATFRVGDCVKICTFDICPDFTTFKIRHFFSSPYPQNNHSRSSFFNLPGTGGRQIVNGVDEANGLYCIWDVSEVPEALSFSFPFPSSTDLHLKDSVLCQNGTHLCSILGDYVSIFQCRFSK